MSSDSHMSRGAELSPDHHLVVSWFQWWGRMPVRPDTPKRIVRICWERQAESLVRRRFNTHLRENFNHVGAASAVMRTLPWSVMVKRELSLKAKLLIYRSICVPTLTKVTRFR